MGLGVPLALLGLALGALPIVAHFLRMRDVPRVELPTIALLRRAEAKSRSRRQLVDRVLLATRVLVVAVLAAIAAQPFRAVPAAVGGGRPVAVALVVDDSASMAARAGGQTLFHDACARATAVAEGLGAGSEAAVILGGRDARVLLPRTADRDRVGEELARASVGTARGTDIARAIELARHELGSSRLATRIIVVLTDGAEHTALERAVRDATGASVEIERVGPEELGPNWAVTTTVARRSGEEPPTFVADVTVHTYGRTPPSARIRVVDGTDHVLDDRDVALEAGLGRAIVALPASALEREGLVVRVDAEDAFEHDDVVPLLVRDDPAYRVLVVDGDPHGDDRRDEVGYFRRALLASAAHLPIEPRVIDRASFAPNALDDVDLLVLANAVPATRDDSDRISDFVAAGGGLLVAPGDRVDAEALASWLGPVLPARVRAAAPSSGLELALPADERWIPEGGVGLSGVRVRSRFLLEPTALEAVVPLRFSDGTPFAVFSGVTRDEAAPRVGVLAVPLDTGGSNLPLRPGYVPLVQRLVEHLSRKAHMTDGPLHGGAPIELPTRVRVREVVGPDGEDVATLRDDGSAAVIDTSRAGLYRVRVAGADGRLTRARALDFVVTAPPEESDPARAPLPATRARGREDVRADTWQRESMIPAFLLVLAALAVLEAWLRLGSRGAFDRRTSRGARRSPGPSSG